MIPETHRWKMCESKRRFKNEKNALNELKKIRKTGKIVPPNAVAYKCPICSKWHLGHKK